MAHVGGRCTGRPYSTAYAGLRSPTGDLMGMLHVGLPLEEMSA